MIQAQVHVHTDHIIGRIDPRIYGHFIEHMGRCIYGGLWAELLQERKFAGHDRHEFGVVSPWVSVGRGTGVVYAHDNTIFHCGRQSQRITARADDGRLHGVAQGPLLLQAGRRYILRLVARQQDVTSPLHLALTDKEGRPYALEQHPCPSGAWHTLQATLTAPVDDPLGRLEITFQGKGTLWLGSSSLMPEDSLAGWRADVLQAARALRPALLRWPGGNFASAYHWRDGVGPRDERPTRPDPAWGALEPNDVGTDEFLALCRLLQAEPYLCVNVGSGTPEEAAAWVEYCNGSAKTPMGRLRAENGHPEPYHVRCWGVGNETYGNWQHGHVDAATYARRCLDFARVMRAVDPSIELVGVGAQAYEAPDWNDTVLELAGRAIDHLSLHHYTPGYPPGALPADYKPDHARLYPAIVAGPERLEELLAHAEADLARHGLSDRLRLALDEWNTWVHPHYECAEAEPYLLRDALYAAGVYHVLQRRCRTIALANLAQLVNVLGAIYTTPAGLFTTPVYLANRLYIEHSGPLSVATETVSPTFAAPAEAYLPARPEARHVDAQATMAEDRRTLYLAIVNRHPDEPLQLQISIEGAPVASQGTGCQLHGPHALAGNSADHPDRVRLQALEPFAAANCFSYSFPAHSATVLELRLSPLH